MCQRYSEMKFKSEIPKFIQQFKKKKGDKTMTEKLGICLILTLNKIKTIWSFKKPLAVSKWGTPMGWSEEIDGHGRRSNLSFFKGRSTRERERERERESWERPTYFSFLFLAFIYWPSLLVTGFKLNLNQRSLLK